MTNRAMIVWPALVSLLAVALLRVPLPACCPAPPAGKQGKCGALSVGFLVRASILFAEKIGPAAAA